jgi:hypothetical protein
MAGNFGNAFKSLLLDHAVGNVAWTPPTALWVALYTAAPGPADLGAEAVMDAGRISYPNDSTGWSVAVNGVKHNLLAIDVPPQSTALGEIVSLGFRDAQTDPSTLCFSFDLIATPSFSFVMDIGTGLHFEPGDLTLNIAG